MRVSNSAARGSERATAVSMPQVSARCWQVEPRKWQGRRQPQQEHGDPATFVDGAVHCLEGWPRLKLLLHPGASATASQPKRQGRTQHRHGRNEQRPPQGSVQEPGSKGHEATFLSSLVAPLQRHGVCIVGTPSLESQPYASTNSKLGHVNCKTQPDLKRTMQDYFDNVFMFSMNDEVVHTGYAKMSHYNIALCCSPKQGR
jgi:hypothetical protein